MDSEASVTQDDLLQALIEARRSVSAPSTSLMNQRIEDARRLFRVAAENDQPPIRRVEMCQVFDWNDAAGQAVIRYLRKKGEIEMRKVWIVSADKKNMKVAGYIWIGEQDEDDAEGHQESGVADGE